MTVCITKQNNSGAPKDNESESVYRGKKKKNRKGKVFPSFDVLRKFLVQRISNLSLPPDYFGT